MDLRLVARACLEAAVEAVDPRRLVAQALAGDTKWVPDLGGPVVVMAAGKAALGMAQGALDVLGDQVDRGIIVVPGSSVAEVADSPPGAELEVIHAGHPVPTASSVVAAERARTLAQGVMAGERFLVLLSGGASALLSLPAGDLTLEDLQVTTRTMLMAGASIDELNTVRKHLDDVKGGGLARMAGTAGTTGLVLSDVIGDRLDVIASGPLTFDSTTSQDAVDLIEKRGLWRQIPGRVRQHLLAGIDRERREIPDSGGSRHRPVDVRIVGNNTMAVEAAMSEADRHGFRAQALTTPLEGEARDVGRRLASLAKNVREVSEPIAPPACLVAGGETTVTVRGSGRGGRNQELALAAAQVLADREGVLLAAFGTDGVDGPTEAAGAWVDGRTLERGTAMGLAASAALEKNDSYSYFAALGDLIITGPTGTNVMDIALLFVE